jgi:hypothetical protein
MLLHVSLKAPPRPTPLRPYRRGYPQGAPPFVVERYQSCFEMSATHCEIRRANTSNVRFATPGLRQSTGREWFPLASKTEA